MSLSLSLSRRSRWRAALAALSLVALTACGGASSPGPTSLPESALVPVAPGDLVAYARDRLVQRAQVGLPATLVLPRAAVQEPGVDEGDLIAIDADRVYALHPGYIDNTELIPPRLTAGRRQANGQLTQQTTATLQSGYLPVGMHLVPAARRLAVLGQTVPGEVVIAASVLPPPQAPTRVSLDVFGLAADGRPSQTARIEIDGFLSGTRQIGQMLYVVTQWTPEVSAFQPPANATPAQRAAILAGLSADALLPRIRVDGAAPRPLVEEHECWLQPANPSPHLQLTTITAFDLSRPEMPRTSRCVLGGLEAIYVAPEHLYLATSRVYWTGANPAALRPGQSVTDIHKFALQGNSVQYRASGEVAGHLGWDQEKKPHRLSEHQGDLRVLSYTAEAGLAGAPTNTPASAIPLSPATLTVLRENASRRQLDTVATLPNTRRPTPLGHAGEQIHAVHFAGSRAYLVTFRRTDPLYLLDLSDPADPRTAGELVTPGFADYLFPVGGDRLVGVGHDADAQGVVQGLQVAWYDVADPAHPRLLQRRTLGGPGSLSALDHSRHGVDVATQGSRIRVALPVRVFETRQGQQVPTWQGLVRWGFDPGTGAVTEHITETTRFSTPGFDPSLDDRFSLRKERARLVDTGSYYLSGGEVRHIPAP